MCEKSASMLTRKLRDLQWIVFIFQYESSSGSILIKKKNYD